MFDQKKQSFRDVKKVFLKNLQNSQENICAIVFF